MCITETFCLRKDSTADGDEFDGLIFESGTKIRDFKIYNKNIWSKYEFSI